MKKIVSAVLLLLLVFSYSCTDELEPAEVVQTGPTDPTDPTDPTNPTDPGQPVFGTPFIKNSELWDLAKRATQNLGDPMTDIVCINFVYPFAVKKYDALMNAIETTTMANDPQFYNYLVSLPVNQPISISYPISTIDSNGELFSVNSNEELIDMLKICAQEAVIGFCNGVFAPPQPVAPCYWRVPYYPGADNTYAGGIFLANEDGTLTFSYNGQTYPGNWIFLHVGNEPHMNINLEGTSAVANYWNIDREVYVNNDAIMIYTQPLNIRLEKHCGTTDTYVIGDTGPANGIVFYDKGSYSDGWRYMEVTSSDLPSVQWGCQGSQAVAESYADGLIGSAKIASFHDASGFYLNPTTCNSQNDGTVASRSALSWQSAGQDDWFLPSEQQLQTVYTNLAANGIGNFSGNAYWTSTEASAAEARVINFVNGSASAQPKTATMVKTRAIRYF
jgi:hypothetical protein